MLRHPRAVTPISDARKYADKFEVSPENEIELQVTDVTVWVNSGENSTTTDLIVK